MNRTIAPLTLSLAVGPVLARGTAAQNLIISNARIDKRGQPDAGKPIVRGY